LTKKSREKEIGRLRYFLAEYERIKDKLTTLKRLPILKSDPNAPICIRCRFCQQQGFLFHCPIYELPEDGKVVGLFGDVYYYRRGHKPKTYSNVPMKSEECEAFEPLFI